MILTNSLDKITAILVDGLGWVVVKPKTVHFDVVANPDSQKEPGLTFIDNGTSDNLTTWISLSVIHGYRLG